MRTQVFAYKGYVGIESDFNAEGLINNPAGDGQLGFVVDAAFVDIHPDALEILKKIPKSHDDIGDVDVFRAGPHIVFAWLGGNLKVLDLKQDISGSNSYEPELLKSNPDVQTPQKFIEFIDTL